MNKIAKEHWEALEGLGFYQTPQALIAQHLVLRQKLQTSSDFTDQRLAELREFITRSSLSGKLIDNADERRLPQTYLYYWHDTLITQHDIEIEPTLAEHDSMLVNDLVDEIETAFVEAEEPLVKKLMVQLISSDTTDETVEYQSFLLSDFLEGNSQLFNEKQVRQTIEKLEMMGVIYVEYFEFGDLRIEVGYTSLLHSWLKFQEWLAEKRHKLQRRRRLSMAAEQWIESGQDENYLWQKKERSDVPYEEELTAVETQFLRACDTAVEENFKQLKKRTQRLTVLVILIGMLLLVASYLGWVADKNRDIAEVSRVTAVAGATEANSARATSDIDATVAVIAQQTAEAGEINAEIAQQTAEAGATTAAEAQVASEIDAQIAVEARATAEAAEATAVYNENLAETEARISSSRELAAVAENNLANNPNLSIMLAVEAMSITLDENASMVIDTPIEVQNVFFRALKASLLKQTVTAHDEEISTIAYSPDGNRIATGSLDSNIKMWDATQGLREIWSSDLHSDAVSQVMFSSDGLNLFSSGQDQFVNLWNVQSGQNIRNMQETTNLPIFSLALNNDGTIFASGNRNGVAYLWNISNPNSPVVTGLFQGHMIGSAVVGITFLDEIERVVTIGRDGRLIFWTNTGVALHSILTTTDDRGRAIPLRSVLASPDGLSIITGDGQGRIKIWQLPDGIQNWQELDSFIGSASPINDMEFSPSGRWLAVAHEDGSVRIWEFATRRIFYILSEHDEAVTSVDFGPTDEILITSDGQTLRQWSIASVGNRPTVLAAHETAVTHIAQNPLGNIFATADDSANIFLWNSSNQLMNSFPITTTASITVTTENSVTSQDIIFDVNNMSFSDDGTWLAVSGNDGRILIWETGKYEETVLEISHGDIPTEIQFQFQNEFIWSSDGANLLKQWNVQTGNLVDTKTFEKPIRAFSINSAGTQLIVSLDNEDGSNSLISQNLETGELLWEVLQESTSVEIVTFSNNGRYFATSSLDSPVQIWTATSGEIHQVLSGHIGRITSISFHPDDSQVVTTSSDRRAILWDFETGQPIFELEDHTASVNDATFTIDGDSLITVGSDTTVQINTIDIETLYQEGLEFAEINNLWLTDQQCEQFLHGDPCLTEEDHE